MRNVCVRGALVGLLLMFWMPGPTAAGDSSLGDSAKREAQALDGLEGEVQALGVRFQLAPVPAYIEFGVERSRLQGEAWEYEWGVGLGLSGPSMEQRRRALDAGRSALQKALDAIPGIPAFRALRTQVSEHRKAQTGSRGTLEKQNRLLELLEFHRTRDKLQKRIASLEAELDGIKDSAVAAHNRQLIAEARAILARIDVRLSGVEIDLHMALAQARAILSLGPNQDPAAALKKRNAGLDDAFSDNDARARVLLQRLDAYIGTSIRPSVTELLGEVSIRGRDGKARPASEGAGLKPGDRIRTGKNSAAAFQGGDGEAIEVGPETDVRIGDTKCTLEVGSGRLHFRRWKANVKKMAKDPLKPIWNVRTPDAQCAIRGSDVIVYAISEALHVLVREGTATLTMKDGSKLETTAGHWITVKSGRATGEPKPLDTEKFNKITRAFWH